MESPAPSLPGRASPASEDEVRRERSIAAAGAGMALFISLAVLTTAFGPEPAGLPAARVAVQAHRELLRAQQEYLRNNEVVLRENREVLARMKRPMGQP